MTEIKDTAKIGNDFYIIETLKDGKVYFNISKQLFSKTEKLKSITIPLSSIDLEKLHKKLIGLFFKGLQKTEDPYKAAEFVENRAKEEYKGLKSEDVLFQEFKNEKLNKICENEKTLKNIIAFLVLKGTKFYKCIRDHSMRDEEVDEIIETIYKFTESSKNAIKNIVGDIKSIHFSIDDKLILYFNETPYTIIIISKFLRLGPQIKEGEKLKNMILEILPK